MDLWRQAPSLRRACTQPRTAPQRRHYRHQIQSLAYLNLDQSNGGIIRNLGDAGIAVQAVAPLCADQQVFLRFDLANPEFGLKARAAWLGPIRSGRQA